MGMDDDEIRDALANAASPPPPTADNFEAIMRRAHRGRARWLGVALVVALVAGPAAGVLVGLNLDDGGKPVTVATGSSQGARRDTAKPTPETATASGAASGSASVSSGGAGFAFATGPALTPLFVRTTADGIAVRAYLGDITPPEPPKVACPDGAPCPILPSTALPADCFPSAMLRAELSNQAAVEPGFVSIPKLAPDQAVGVVQAGFFGVQEGSPAAWATVHTTDAVATVRVRFADGTVDEMTPVQGYAVLAHQTPAPPPPDPSAGPEAFKKSMLPEGTVEGLDASGAVVATAALTDQVAPSAPCTMPEPVPAPAPPQAVPPVTAAP